MPHWWIMSQQKLSTHMSGSCTSICGQCRPGIQSLPAVNLNSNAPHVTDNPAGNSRPRASQGHTGLNSRTELVLRMGPCSTVWRGGTNLQHAHCLRALPRKHKCHGCSCHNALCVGILTLCVYRDSGLSSRRASALCLALCFPALLCFQVLGSFYLLCICKHPQSVRCSP